MKAQDLKNSILQMAMEGKLVPQDSNDEPASVLLERIKEEKEQLMKEKKIKRNNKESVIFRKNNHFYEKVGKKGEEVCIDDEIPWVIPDSWEWCKLGNLISIITGTSYKKGDITSDGLRILRGGNIQDNKVFLLDDDIFLPAPDYYDSQKEIKKGDILIVASTGSKKVIGKPGFVNETYENVSIGAFLRICRPLINYLSDYIQIVFGSEYYRNHIRTLAQGTNINNVKKEYLENLFVPLPPLNEQKRIFKKIEELLPLIEDYDILEDKLNKLNEEFPNKIKDSILQDAIQGKLVPQDSNDEPASILLERIRDEKERLIKEKKIKTNKNESFIFRENNHFYEKIGKKEPICIDSELPFEIPDNWEWTRIKNISEFVTKGTTPKGGKSAYKNEGIKFLRVENIGKDGELLLENIKYVSEDTHYNFLKRSILKENDLLISIAGALGRTAIVPINALPLNTNQAVSLVRWCNTELIFVPYIEKAVNSPEIQRLLLKQSKITAIPNLTLEIIRECLIPIPPLSEQKRIVMKINELLTNINNF